MISLEKIFKTVTQKFAMNKNNLCTMFLSAWATLKLVVHSFLKFFGLEPDAYSLPPFGANVIFLTEVNVHFSVVCFTVYGAVLMFLKVAHNIVDFELFFFSGRRGRVLKNFSNLRMPSILKMEAPKCQGLSVHCTKQGLS